jgi:hypothetical protein
LHTPVEPPHVLPSSAPQSQTRPGAQRVDRLPHAPPTPTDPVGRHEGGEEDDEITQALAPPEAQGSTPVGPLNTGSHVLHNARPVVGGGAIQRMPPHHE